MKRMTMQELLAKFDPEQAEREAAEREAEAAEAARRAPIEAQYEAATSRIVGLTVRIGVVAEEARRHKAKFRELKDSRDKLLSRAVRGTRMVEDAQGRLRFARGSVLVNESQVELGRIVAAMNDHRAKESAAVAVVKDLTTRRAFAEDAAAAAFAEMFPGQEMAPVNVFPKPKKARHATKKAR